MPPRRPEGLWLRLPRLVYWVAGAAISFGGAAGARLIAAAASPSQRVPIWIVGAVLVFVGLAVLSLGTKGRLEIEELFTENGDQADGDGKNPTPPPATPQG